MRANTCIWLGMSTKRSIKMTEVLSLAAWKTGSQKKRLGLGGLREVENRQRQGALKAMC